DDFCGQLLAHVPDLNGIDYDPCFTVMLALKGESLIPEPGAIRSPNSVIDWIADNSRKHDTGKSAAVTVHCSADFSRQYFDAPHEDVAAAIIEAASPWLGCEVEAWQVHRWRYAKPRHSLAIPTVALGDKHPLLLCGDYLSASARIEGAFDSGVAAAEHILAHT
ncbi:MAG: renalase, partial [Rhodothermales bacterium]